MSPAEASPAEASRWPRYDDIGGPAAHSHECLRGRRVLVTGCRGFLGSHLVRRLVELGAEIHGVSRRGGAGPAGGPTVWPADLRDPDAVAAVLRAVAPQVVFHLAGEVSGSRDPGFVRPALEGNVVTTVNLLTAATELGAPRVVLAGSMEEPHPGGPRGAPSSPYAVSKWAAGAYAQLFHGLWSLPTVVLRIAMAYGPAQPDARKLVPYVIESLLAGRAPALTSGTREIDWVYVDDVVDAFVAAACVPDVAGRTFDVGSGTAVDIRRTVELVAKIIGNGVEPVFGAVGDRALDSARIADVRAAAAVLGWRSAVGLDDGLTRTVEWHAAGRHAEGRGSR